MSDLKFVLLLFGTMFVYDIIFETIKFFLLTAHNKKVMKKIEEEIKQEQSKGIKWQ